MREKLTLFSKGRNRMRPTVHILGYVIKHLDFSWRVCTVNPKGFPNRSVKNAALSCDKFRSSFANSQHPKSYQYYFLKILKIFEKKTIQCPYPRFVFWFCASISSQLTLGPLLQRNNRRVNILEMAFLCDVMMARMA